MRIHYSSFLVFSVLLSMAAFAQHGRDGGRRSQPAYRYARYDNRPHVSVIASLPFGAIRVNVGNAQYHYCDGFYYRPYSTGYVMIEPPIGVIVPVLPPSRVIVVTGGRPYYYFNGVYYLQADGGYQVVDKPTDTPVTTAPSSPSTEKQDAYEKIVIEGKTYYKKGDSYYKAAIDDKGEIVYEKVGEVGK